MRTSVKSLAVVFALACAESALAAPAITVGSVVQRQPGTNAFDITYTISGDGGQDIANYSYCKVVFTATIPGRAEPVVIDGSSDVVAKADNGTWTVVWTNAPAGVKAENCTMTAALYRTTGDYMVVDLDTGAYAFDDLAAGDTPTATPTASTARYNIPLYKTVRMVFRRVPRTAAADQTAYGSGYPTGHADYSAPTYTGPYTNSVKRWTMDKDFFAGVFEVTQAQYEKLNGSNPSRYKNEPNSPLYPVEAMKYYDAFVRGAFFPKLRGVTGLQGFNLPTEVMWEIAARAGATTKYPWGDGVPIYAKCNCYSFSPYKSVAVGSREPNAWGLFDMSGNVDEYCLDCASSPNDMADRQSPWDFVQRAGNAVNYMKRGGGWDAVKTSGMLRASCRIRSPKSWDQGDSAIGFRVFFVAQ